MSFERSTIKIPSATLGWDLDAWRYIPVGNSNKPYPVIVMAHSLTRNKLMLLSSYAETFASIGYAVLVFDYRRRGASNGLPRSIVNVKEQLEDYRTVVKYARQQADFDGQRLIIWGTSFSGGHAMALGSESGVNAAAVICRGPFTGGSLPIEYSASLIGTAAYVVADALKQLCGLDPIYISAAAQPGCVGGLVAPGTLEGFLSLAVNEGDYPNQISASSLFQLFRYIPRKNAALIKCPILVIICGRDILCSATDAQKVADVASKGEAILLANAGHFDIYPGKEFYDSSVKAELEFLQRVVPLVHNNEHVTS